MLIPLLSYFDDFAAFLRAGLSEKAISVFARFCDILRFQLKAGKSSAGNKKTFLGRPGTSPADSNRGKLLISLTDAKRAKRPHLLDSYLKSGTISHSCL